MKNFNELEKNNGQYSFSEVSEKLGLVQTRDKYIPGRFYSLKIKSPVPDLTDEIVPLLNFGRPYYDLNPIGLSLFNENFKKVTVFLNLKVIPPNILSKLLEAYYYFSKQNGLSNLFQNGKLIDLNERRLLDQKFYFLPSTILSQVLGLKNINYAINKYNNDSILEAKLIDWDNYGMLVNPRLSTNGLFPNPINMSNIFEDFIQNSVKQ